MAQSCTLALNEDYLNTRAFPAQRSRFIKLYDGLKRRGIDPKIQRIRFEGKDNLAVIGNIANQIRGMMRDLFEGWVISFLGDSGGGPFLSAMQHNLEEHPVSTDNSLTPHGVLVAAGGSLNNLSRHLGTAKRSDVMGIMSGEIPYRTQEIKIRSVTISTFDGPGGFNGNGGKGGLWEGGGREPGGKGGSREPGGGRSYGEHRESAGRRGNKLAEQISPWTCFLGAGLDGYALYHWEMQPRTSPLAVRGINAAKEGFKHLFGEKGGARAFSHSFIAIPNMSLFYFGQEFDSLDQPYVHHIHLDRRGAGDVMKSFAVCMGIGLVPAINSAIWARCPDERAGAYPSTLRGIADEIKPRRFAGCTRVEIPASEPFLEIDGYPMDMRSLGLREGGHAELEISTTPRSIYVARRTDA